MWICLYTAVCMINGLGLGAVCMRASPVLLVYGLYIQAAGEHRATLCTKCILLTLSAGSGTKHKKVCGSVLAYYLGTFSCWSPLRHFCCKYILLHCKTDQAFHQYFFTFPEDTQYMFAWRHLAYVLSRIWWLDSDFFSVEITILYYMCMAH